MFHRHNRIDSDREFVGEPVAAPALGGEAATRAFFETCFAATDPTIETLFVAHLDDHTRCIHLSHYDGDQTGADLPLREIMRDALTHDSKGIIVAHNHPSGNAMPSASDRRATGRLARVSEAIDLTLVDHLVFGGGNCTSFRRIGLL